MAFLCCMIIDIGLPGRTALLITLVLAAYLKWTKAFPAPLQLNYYWLLGYYSSVFWPCSGLLILPLSLTLVFFFCNYSPASPSGFLTWSLLFFSWFCCPAPFLTTSTPLACEFLTTFLVTTLGSGPDYSTAPSGLLPLISDYPEDHDLEIRLEVSLWGLGVNKGRFPKLCTPSCQHHTYCDLVDLRLL